MDITISSRNRNLSYGWTTQPTGHDTDIAQPACPRVQGGLATLTRQLAQRRRVSSGGAHVRDALFVGGQRVVCEWPDRVSDLIAALEHGAVTVTLADAAGEEGAA